MCDIKQYIKGSSFINLAYRDYIAARFLLNNEFIIQGLTLASTAVEKYLKALIIFTSKNDDKYSFHLDRLDELKKKSDNCGEVINLFDPIFLDIVQKSYSIRYYDKIQGSIEFGFLINQFIGELDYTINHFESVVLVNYKMKTPYDRAIKNKEPHLYDNNYILQNLNKKEYMENPSNVFSICAEINRELVVKGGPIRFKYNGIIAIFNEFQTTKIFNIPSVDKVNFKNR